MACHKHEDCVEGFYCHNEDTWPLRSACRAYRADNAECDEDYQCPITHFCWYRTAEEKAVGTKRCMEQYSQPVGTKFGWSQENEVATLADYTQNGKFCLDGLAFKLKDSDHEAQCTKTDTIRWYDATAGDLTDLPAPYQCEADDPNNKCRIVYELGKPEESDFEVLCKCSLQETENSKGFCESVIGTETYAKAVSAKKLL